MMMRYGAHGLLGRAMAVVIGTVSGVTLAHAEGFDRVYQAEVQVTPTPLVVGNGAVAPEVLKVQLGPNIRTQQAEKAVSQGQDTYRLGQYRTRLRLHHGADGGYDNGAVSYTVSASLGRVANGHAVSIVTRVKGTLSLHNGQGSAPLPANRYFGGTIQVNALAGGL